MPRHLLEVLAVLSDGTNVDISTNIVGNFLVRETPEIFVYDADGNLADDCHWTYSWDGENRLIRMTALSSVPTGARMDLAFDYDSKGRRISKIVSNWTGSAWARVLDEKYVYDDWNLIAVLNGTNGNVLRSFIWGTDLSGNMRGAGGVGGLLAMNDAAVGVHFAAYDGNGNVTALAKAADGSTSAVYEYSAFGEPIRATGPAAQSNPFRFSTKLVDQESRYSYYGHRYLGNGNWPNRDPIAETGGLNLYGFVGNSPLNKVDRLGLRDDPGPTTPLCVPDCPICSPPPDPSTGKPGYDEIPYWFEHPVDEGKPCCCESGAKLKSLKGQTTPPHEQSCRSRSMFSLRVATKTWR